MTLENPRARRVLIIDDNEDAADLLALCVAAMGHTAEVANSGVDGLRLAAAWVPEVVFLDLGMPGMTGFEVAPRLRAIAGLDGVFIAALTGWNDTNTRQRVIASGFDRHLTKPASLELIRSILDER